MRHRKGEHIDLALLANVIAGRLRWTGMSARRASEESGTSTTTMHRAMHRDGIDLDTYVKLCAWLGVSLDTFVVGRQVQVEDEQ